MCIVDHCMNNNYTNGNYVSNYCKKHEFSMVENTCEMCNVKKYMMRYITKCQSCKMKLHENKIIKPIIIPTYIFVPK
jgi:hypothetical protein